VSERVAHLCCISPARLAAERRGGRGTDAFPTPQLHGEVTTERVNDPGSYRARYSALTATACLDWRGV